MQPQETDKIVIYLHSIVDVITNSSTELFIIDSKKSVEAVKEILSAAIELHNKANNTNFSFSDIFDDPYEGDAAKALDGWEDYYHSRKKTGIILQGASDNSIPYWMFDFIEETFGYNTERFHLG